MNALNSRKKIDYTGNKYYVITKRAKGDKKKNSFE